MLRSHQGKAILSAEIWLNIRHNVPFRACLVLNTKTMLNCRIDSERLSLPLLRTLIWTTEPPCCSKPWIGHHHFLQRCVTGAVECLAVKLAFQALNQQRFTWVFVDRASSQHTLVFRLTGDSELSWMNCSWAPVMRPGCVPWTKWSYQSHSHENSCTWCSSPLVLIILLCGVTCSERVLCVSSQMERGQVAAQQVPTFPPVSIICRAAGSLTLVLRAGGELGKAQPSTNTPSTARRCFLSATEPELLPVFSEDPFSPFFLCL